MEDIVMTDINKDESKETKDNTLYQEYRKAMINIERAITLIDSKTLYLYSRLLNKFRRGFTDEDCEYICDNFIRSKFNIYYFKVVSSKPCKETSCYHNCHCISNTRWIRVIRINI